MELIFLRHAQPEWSRAGKSAMNPGLTALGAEQARRLGEAIARWPHAPDELWVSPTERTRRTSDPIRQATSLDATIIDCHEEIRLPNWEGTPAEQVDRALREARSRSLDEWWDGLPGGESFRHFHQRITSGLAALLAERGCTPDEKARPHIWRVPEGEQRILIVGHAGSNAVALGYLLGLEPVPWEWERFMSRHASVTRIKTQDLAHGAIFSLRSFSDVSHLAPELWTR